MSKISAASNRNFWLKILLHFKDSHFTHPYEHLYRSIRFANKNGITASTHSTIIDAGAYDGETAMYFNSQFPLAHIKAFEPNPEAFAIAQKRIKKNPNIELIQSALSDENGKFKFNITYNQVSSSLHAVKSSFFDEKENFSLEKQLEIVRQVEVDLIRLDDLMLKEVLILKMDTQGNELKIIKGGIETLKKTWLIVTEMVNRNLYEGGCKYYEVDEALRSLGFEAIDWIVPSRRGGIRMEEFDAIYVNRNFKPRL